jgi:hypothetical protein
MLGMRFLKLTPVHSGKKVRVNFALVSEYGSLEISYKNEPITITRIAYADDNCLDVLDSVEAIDNMLGDDFLVGYEP